VGIYGVLKRDDNRTTNHYGLISNLDHENSTGKNNFSTGNKRSNKHLTIYLHVPNNEFNSQ